MTAREKIQKDLEILLDQEYGYVRAGYPKFMRLFGRDALIVAWQLLDIEPEICHRTLEILSDLQGQEFDSHTEEEPGKIIHETDLRLKHHPTIPEMDFPYYGSIDSTELYLIVFGKYFNKVKDWDFLVRHLTNIKSATDWILRKVHEDDLGFVRYHQRKENWQIIHQGWKDSFRTDFRISSFPVALVEVQGYAYLALLTASQLLEDSSLLKEADSLRQKFNDLFWMADLGYFALALDGRNTQVQAITSNPGHLLFSGILSQKQADYVVKKLFEPDMFTNYGIRTHSTKEPDFDYQSYQLGSIWPHDNWIIAQGCKSMGYHQAYQKIRQSILKAYYELGYLPECYAVTPSGVLEDIPTACRPQAWAVGAVLEFLASEK